MRQDPEGYARTCEALAKASAADPRLIAAPTLLVTGDADAVNPPSVAQALADKIAGASIEDHGPWRPLATDRESAANATRGLPIS